MGHTRIRIVVNNQIIMMHIITIMTIINHIILIVIMTIETKIKVKVKATTDEQSMKYTILKIIIEEIRTIIVIIVVNHIWSKINKYH
jgi:hypothetical protein